MYLDVLCAHQIENVAIEGKEGRKEGWTEGRTEGRKEGRKGGRKESNVRKE
jgi:hypothetical protein